jgi:class 3 adenylate cyclase
VRHAAPAGAFVQETGKVVTILFADVTGSTAIGERPDAEAGRRVLATFNALAREVLERRCGTVEKLERRALNLRGSERQIFIVATKALTLGVA